MGTGITKTSTVVTKIISIRTRKKLFKRNLYVRYFVYLQSISEECTWLHLGHDLNRFSPEICQELSEFLHVLHSIEWNQFGYMSEQPGVGVYSSWMRMFENDFNHLTEAQYQLSEM